MDEQPIMGIWVFPQRKNNNNSNYNLQLLLWCMIFSVIVILNNALTMLARIEIKDTIDLCPLLTLYSYFI